MDEAGLKVFRSFNACRKADLEIRRLRRTLLKIASGQHCGCVCGSMDPTDWDDRRHTFYCPENIARRALKPRRRK